MVQLWAGLAANVSALALLTGKASTTNARKVIDYAPQDDSEVRFADDIARLLHGRKQDA